MNNRLFGSLPPHQPPSSISTCQLGRGFSS
jgi:hypothetical protein